MLEKNIQASPKETLSSNSSPTEIANFARGLNLGQFRRAVEVYNTRKYKQPLILILNKAASLSP